MVNFIFALASLVALTSATSTGMCGTCNPKLMWSDIVLVIDGSMDQQMMSSYIQSTFSQMDIGQDPKSQTRIGVVVYGEKAQVLAQLTTLTSSNQFLGLKIQQVAAQKYSIVNGIAAAQALFMDPKQYRAGTPHLMVIVGQDIRNDEKQMAEHMAERFNWDYGEILTISPHSTIPSSISRLAHYGGFKLYQDKDKPEDVLQRFCDANCFCPSTYSAASDDSYAPHEGCIRLSDTPRAEVDAKADCTQLNEVLMRTKDEATQSLATSGYAPGTLLYVGLEGTKQGDGSTKWMWNDGTLFDTTANNITGSGTCGLLYSHYGIFHTFLANDCFTKQYYGCLRKPCSVNNNCLKN